MRKRKSADIVHAYNDQETVIFHFERQVVDKVNYQIVERIKNGIVWSSKYNSMSKLYMPGHVICFATFLPEEKQLSLDRWAIKEIVGDGWMDITEQTLKTQQHEASSIFS